MPDFNRIAPFYDFLSGIIFGQRLLEAQRCFIKRIQPGSKILILGGGSGKILNYIFEHVPGNVQIDFIEPSEKMLKLAQKNTADKFSGNVNFIHGDQFSISEKSSYDVLAVFFVYDIFKREEAISFTKEASAALKNGGLLLFADFFKTESSLQKTKLWLMYRFFKLISGISAGKLPDYDVIFKQFNLILQEEKCFMNCFVKARLYIKN